jgi:hypothetical protein
VSASRALKQFGVLAASGLFLLVCVYSIFSLAIKAFTVYPTPETKSAFLKNYSPKDVIESFDTKQGGQGFESDGSNAHRGFATHQRDFTQIFHMQTDKRAEFMATIRAGILSQLRSQNAHIFAESSQADGSFKLKYVTGKTEGSVVLSPLENVQETPQERLGREGIDVPKVLMHLHIDETWFKHPKQSAS